MSSYRRWAGEPKNAALVASMQRIKNDRLAAVANKQELKSVIASL
jgi:hypothetical protein